MLAQHYFMALVKGNMSVESLPIERLGHQEELKEVHCKLPK